MHKNIASIYKIFSLFLLFCLFGSSITVSANTNAKDMYKKVLIINSYHKGLSWTDEEVDGITAKLKTSNISSEIYTEYMDWKRYPSPENLDLFYSNIKLKYSDKSLDLVICTDDAALQFALKNRSKLFINVPIVFCGINEESVSELINGNDNVTGVEEGIDPENTIKLALKINPSLKDIYLIYDNTESGISTGKLTSEAIRKINNHLNIIPLNDKSLDEIIKISSTLKDDSIILLANYSTDIYGNFIDNKDFTKIIGQASSVPLFHLYDFGVGNGSIGGSLLSGKLQGTEAAKIAIDILSGKSIATVPISKEKTIHTIFDYTQLKRFNVKLNELPKNSEIINKPHTIIESYPVIFYSTLSIFICLLIFIITLLFYIKKINKMKLELQDNHEHLTQLYEELAATDEELRSQFDELLTTQDKLEKSEERLEYLAFHDTLTGLYNRLYLFEEIGDFFNDTTSKTLAAMFFIDTDNFKFINDTMGHSFGDKLIISVAKRLLSFTNDNCTLIRLGGDEFILFIKDIKERKSIEKIAQNIIMSFNEPFNIEDNFINITLSIGISIYPDHGRNTDELLRHSDIAMYKVKSQGRNDYYFFNNLINEEIITRVNIEKLLKKALDNNEFVLYYQPQVNITTKEIDGFEALIRWISPELGTVSPYKFINIAEETGFIIPLGEWILKSACSYIQALNERKSTSYKISVNISVIQFLQDNFTDIVNKVLNETNLPSSLLELEITESIIMDSPDVIVEKIKFLRSKNIRIALDDFGTGYSSLFYLRKIPITTLKIDKVFIDDIISEEADSTVTDSIISLGHKMGLSIVAEGVETEKQLKYLEFHKCDKLQGYLFWKPLSEQEVEKIT